ncbi:MAG: hypothetical protein L3J71_12990 [Victivallaceae bacterium]|nr:hypothetical protein [Victivallaceae bacterium]
MISYNRFKYNGTDPDKQAGIMLGNIQNATQGWNYCYNNTVFLSKNGIILSAYGNYWKVKNNIIQSSTKYHIWAKGGSTAYPNREWDYNCFWWDGVNKFNFAGTESNISLWRTATNQDLNSLVYGNVFASELRLAADSDCINSGTPVGLTEDADGDPIVGNPDIGYDEYTN